MIVRVVLGDQGLDSYEVSPTDAEWRRFFAGLAYAYGKKTDPDEAVKAADALLRELRKREARGERDEGGV